MSCFSHNYNQTDVVLVIHCQICQMKTRKLGLHLIYILLKICECRFFLFYERKVNDFVPIPEQNNSKNYGYFAFLKPLDINITDTFLKI